MWDEGGIEFIVKVDVGMYVIRSVWDYFFEI